MKGSCMHYLTPTPKRFPSGISPTFPPTHLPPHLIPHLSYTCLHHELYTITSINRPHRLPLPTAAGRAGSDYGVQC
ncbi:hypothetical protein E2C01_036454 [Portunus trituberculatus]|uniref:Uncharacterized protein n=1 Tax=Portunus trituberculatus TaxID=210409 RepID=A0A5B7FCH9_PORTR|nr:hypothetical protein [Portunus trituberculatus]